MSTCKITIIRRTVFPDLAAEYIQSPVGPCPAFHDGQEFIVDPSMSKPAGFCDWAWNDLTRFVTALSRGGNFSTDIFAAWMRDDRSMIACCTDGIRPVVFKIERLESQESP
jgi:uncharacterized repeat protein (TIGR04076 family)